MILLKVTQNQDVTLCLEDTLLERPQHGWRAGLKLDPTTIAPPKPSYIRFKRELKGKDFIIKYLHQTIKRIKTKLVSVQSIPSCLSSSDAKLLSK